MSFDNSRILSSFRFFLTSIPSMLIPNALTVDTSNSVLSFLEVRYHLCVPRLSRITPIKGGKD